MEYVGLADVERGVKIGPNTTFDLASATKMFTATAILLLVERGALEVTDSISEYLTFVREPRTGRPITVRDLLWHTSGLPDYLQAGILTDVHRLSPEYVQDQVTTWSQEARPGEAYAYSNTNYFVLSKLVEALTGDDFALFIQDNLLIPFGLNDSFVSPERGDSASVARGYLNMGYGLATFETSQFDLATLGDGGLFSSLRDLLRWQTLFWGGKIVSEGSLEAMQTPGRLDSGKPFTYGFGMQLETREDGSRWCGHGGSWAGTSVLVGRYVRERTSVIVLSNEQMAPVERISQRAHAVSLQRKHGQPPPTARSS